MISSFDVCVFPGNSRGTACTGRPVVATHLPRVLYSLRLIVRSTRSLAWTDGRSTPPMLVVFPIPRSTLALLVYAPRSVSYLRPGVHSGHSSPLPTTVLSFNCFCTACLSKEEPLALFLASWLKPRCCPNPNTGGAEREE